MVFYSAFVWQCTDMCKHRFEVNLLQNLPLCSSTTVATESILKFSRHIPIPGTVHIFPFSCSNALSAGWSSAGRTAWVSTRRRCTWPIVKQTLIPTVSAVRVRWVRDEVQPEKQPGSAREGINYAIKPLYPYRTRAQYLNHLLHLSKHPMIHYMPLPSKIFIPLTISANYYLELRAGTCNWKQSILFMLII